ncbi:MAG: sodium:proton antiporter [Deltaproteobacteria bacterium]|nr:sodium:proton antiporter [Deltaproteobacteria bacterium]
MSDSSAASAHRTTAVALFGSLGLALVALALVPAPHHGDLSALASGLRWWTVVPFALLLACIAIAPLAVPKAWEHNSVKATVCLGLALPVCIYLAAAFGPTGVSQLVEKAKEYVSFLCLLASLFVISGGIVVRGSLSGTPLMNTALLAIGALLANLVGTTGASMLLIRPLLRANATREKKAHVIVFFIFIVANCGGLLTPLGDPPLFLGFLKGVPFEWTLQRLFLPWLLVNGLLLVVFQILDQGIFNAEEARRPGSQLEEVMKHEPLRIEGLFNLGLLSLVVLIIFASGRGLFLGGDGWPFGWQEGAMLALAVVSFLATSNRLHTDNGFSFAPIVEVAVLFAGIFATMAPALLLLNAQGPSLGLSRPWHFFWATGSLSSFLDNAPTYLTFAATAAGLQGIGAEGRYLAQLLSTGEGPKLLAAISAGAVMMGANTYIGNGPNFMVKAVAESSGVKMPSFFGYMAYSALFLIPVFVVVTLVFFAA